MRMATFPQLHPLSTYIKRAALRRVQHHSVPLHGLLNDFEINPKRFKKVDHSESNWTWTLGFSTQVARSWNEGVAMDQNDLALIQIYMDSSGMDG